MSWKVLFYKTQANKSPVEEWLQGLSIKTQAKILRNLSLLETFDLNLKQPYVKPLEDQLHEIRTKDTQGIYRVIYFAYKNKEFIMLNGFTKKTQKTPRKEIELAKKRMKEIIDE
jgi:phage-related protein